MTTDRPGERRANTIAVIVGIPLALIFAIWMMWITWTAFAGGQAWPHPGPSES